MRKVLIQKEPLDLDKLMKEAGTDRDGSVVTFIGRARNESMGKRVEYLYYEIYNGMALKEIEKIVNLAAEKWSLSSCLVVHRYGRIGIGEPSIAIAVSSPHREESFQSAQYIISEIKDRVPIWKKEYYSDGSEWISGKSENT